MLERCWLRTLFAIFLLPTIASLAQSGEYQSTSFQYLPPSWAERVVFYHTFDQGTEKPDINLIQAKLDGTAADGEGLTGLAYQCGKDSKHKALRLKSSALSPHQPITVMCWFRLDAPMKEESGFGLIGLSSPRGYVSYFVHGKGEWCALREPKGITQVQNFKGIPRINNCEGPRIWFEPGTWHHIAITVSSAKVIKVFQDGVECDEISLKGGTLKEGDFDLATFGAGENEHPQSIDDVLVLDRALDAGEIAEYVKSTLALAAIHFPVRSQPAPVRP